MAIVLTKKAAAALRSPETVKLIATVGKEGEPHVAVKDTLTLLPDGTIAFYELIETSKTQKNLVYSLWFSKRVSVLTVARDGESHLIKGVPYRAVTAGGAFLEAYEDVQKRYGPDADLSAIWLIPPEWERENTLAVRRAEEEIAHPYEIHMDRIAKEALR
ncbi:MAG: hypothetical protein LBP73_09700 [Clostridiales Family XIII bacterium]|jgi:hypothetical protein|nr:hypothetical protein [Clostridiales Family XIII bacterium]